MSEGRECTNVLYVLYLCIHRVWFFISNIKYYLKQKTFFLKKNVFAYIMEKNYSIDIDTKIDFEFGEFIKSKKNK